jgi:hypothetical protein
VRDDFAGDALSVGLAAWRLFKAAYFAARVNEQRQHVRDDGDDYE